jgi:hypothetical protein
MRDPLSRVRGDARVRIGFGAFRERPQLALDVMQVISIWAHTDVELSCLTATFLKADFTVVSAMLDALTGGEAKRAAINAAANAVLDKSAGDEWDLYQKVMSRIRPSRLIRNDFTHKLWATAEELPDALLLVEPSEQIRKNDQFAILEAGTWRPGVFAFPQLDKNRVTVYRDQELKQAVKDAEAAYYMISKLSGALGEPGPYSEQQWLALSLELGEGPSPPVTFRKKNVALHKQ